MFFVAHSWNILSVTLFSLIFTTAGIVLPLLEIEGIILILSQRVSECLSVLNEAGLGCGKASITDLDVGVSSTSILVIPDWLRVKMWVPILSKLSHMILSWQKTSGMKLSSCLLHLAKASVVVENVGVSTCSIYLIVNSSISHHFNSVMISGSTNGCWEFTNRLMPKALRILKHFFNFILFYLKKYYNIIWLGFWGFGDIFVGPGTCKKCLPALWVFDFNIR